ncbi:hypothetical protein JF72_13400 [Lactobacillus apis]|uniref:GNAT family acetyltransferase n=1 Tax=Lactobacillus apis TaxID=303541 RepID=A0A0F4LN70_9LACO|nr:hypothetical protein JF72_13400 [Lactobacillus apis]
MYNELLADVIEDREIKTATKQYPQNVRTYCLGNKIVGISTYWKNGFHPYSLSFAAYLSPNFSAAELERVYLQIVADLTKKAQQEDCQALITYDYAPQLLFNFLAQDDGFNLIRKTVEPKMSLQSAMEGLTPIKKSNLKAITLHQVQLDSEMREKIAQISFSDYQRNHLANPVAEIPLTEWDNMVFADQLEDAPLALISMNQIEAYCFSFEDNPKELTLGWMGAGDLSRLMELQQILLLWANKNFQVLSGEFDSTDQLSMKTYQQYAFELCPVYETYLKRL